MLEKTVLSIFRVSPEFSVRLVIRHVEFVAIQVPESGAAMHDVWSFKSIVVAACASCGISDKTVISTATIGIIKILFKSTNPRSFYTSHYKKIII